MSTIVVDAKPYKEFIDDAPRENYQDFVRKGTLLLWANRTKEARQTFEQAYDLADEHQMKSAIENVARAIRADTGSIGQANAYILSLRAGQAK